MAAHATTFSRRTGHRAPRGIESGGAQPVGRGRVVAIGDIHADLTALRAALRTAGAIDAKDRLP